MKIQCDSCERAEAAVLCCADEAVLCWECDQKVHGANKLASKHERVPLLSHGTQVPKCDICQEKVGHFFCLEDRALLCRQCDVSIHSMSSNVRTHQRFLLTGVKLGLTQQCLQPAVSQTATTSPSTSATTTQQSPRLATSAAELHRTANETMATNVVNPATFYNSENPSGPDFGTHWPLDDILASTVEYDQSYFFSELGSSRDSS